MFEQTPAEKAVNMVRVRLDATTESIRRNHAEWQRSRKRERSVMVTHHETVIAVKVREAKFLKRLLNTLTQV